jgi:hypothetical protein
MARYEISDQVRDNILIFLDRVELKGNEAEPLVQIKYILLNPIQEGKPESN